MDCHIAVNDDSDTMARDFCSDFTHMACDPRLNTDLYECLAKHEDNPLLYLCKKCRNILVPKQPGQLVQGIILRFESMLKTKTNVADDILNVLSSKISELDKLVKAHQETYKLTQSKFAEILVQNSSSNRTPIVHTQSYAEKLNIGRMAHHSPSPSTNSNFVPLFPLLNGNTTSTYSDQYNTAIKSTIKHLQHPV